MAFVLATILLSLLGLWLLYAIISLVIILRFNADVSTALTPSLPADSFNGKVVWITGAGSGLGEQLALCLAERSSVKVMILSSRKKEALERVAAECHKKRPNVQIHVLPMDLSDLASLPDKVQEALNLLEEGNKMDVLINAAGVTTRSFATDSNFHLDEYVTRVNYLGPVRLLKCLLHQNQLPTSLIQLSSIAGKIGVPVRTSYSGSKFALHGWLEALMIESVLQQRQLYVLGCILGSISTDLGNHALVNVTENGTVETLSEMDENLGRGLDPATVAERILAVSYAQKYNETWIAPRHELIPVLYFATYFRHTAFVFLTKVMARKYAVTNNNKQKNKKED